MPESPNFDFPARLVVTLAIWWYLVAWGARLRCHLGQWLWTRITRYFSVPSMLIFSTRPFFPPIFFISRLPPPIFLPHLPPPSSSLSEHLTVTSSSHIFRILRDSHSWCKTPPTVLAILSRLVLYCASLGANGNSSQGSLDYKHGISFKAQLNN